MSESVNKSQRKLAACFQSKATRFPGDNQNPSTGLVYDVKIFDVASRVANSPLKMKATFRVPVR